jgi:5-methylcytosine-specific restriction endonuclease McrA
LCKKMLATPVWVDEDELESVYLNCPNGYAVDHIVPLQGKNVSGLHVPWNLQYLTRSDNSKKKNKHESDGYV